MSRRKTAGIIGIALIALLVIGLGSMIRPMSVLSVSNVYIQQKGQEGTDGEWKGSYWIIEATTRSTENILTYKFDSTESGAFDLDKVGTEELIPTSTIEIHIESLQPYWKRPLTLEAYNVLPETMATRYDASPFVDPHWYKEEKHARWNGFATEVVNSPLPSVSVTTRETTSDWTLHAPFTLRMTKTDENGTVTYLEDALSGEQQPVIDMVGTDATVPFQFVNPNRPEETVTVTLEGLLTTGYYITLGNLVVLPGDWVFEKTSGFLQDIQYDASSTSYSEYWLGPVRWTDDGTPKPCSEGNLLNEPWTNYGGWYHEQWGVIRQDRWTAKELYLDSNPPLEYTGGVQYRGLYNYLDYRHNQLSGPELDRWGQGYNIEDNDITINLPQGSVSWLYTLMLSTELADTIVWQPLVTTGEITDGYFLSTGTNEATISDYDELVLEINNNGTEDGTLSVSFTSFPADAPFTITGKAINLFQGETKKAVFPIENLGPTNQTKVTLNATLRNSVGQIVDSKIYVFDLMPKGGGNTMLTVYTLDAETDEHISGIPITVNWDSQGETKLTSMGKTTFDLGSISGTVDIVAEETVYYQSGTEQTEVSPGINTVYLKLYKHGVTPPPPEDWTWLILLALAGIAVAVSLGYLKKRRRG